MSQSLVRFILLAACACSADGRGSVMRERGLQWGARVHGFYWRTKDNEGFLSARKG